MKISYFNAKGRAELSRLILTKAGVEFEDNRFEFADWPAIKESGVPPNGTAPWLETADITLGESMPMARYLANKFNLAGKDKMQILMADTLVVKITEIHVKYMLLPFKYEDEQERAAAQKELDEVESPKYMRFISAVLEANGGDWLVGDAMTWADIALFNFLGCRVDMAVLKEKYPKVPALVTKVGEDAAIKPWVESHPN